MFFSFPDEFKIIKPRPGVTMYQIAGERLMLSYLRDEGNPDFDRSKPPQPLPGHKHDYQEQIVLLLKGEVPYTVGGESRVLRAMDAIVIPPGVMHSITPKGGEVEVLEIYSPPSVPKL